MNEFQKILTTIQTIAEPCLLATLVSAQGSTYRRPGARMLILPDEQTIGMISGGCLEQDVVERSRSIWASGKPLLITYDTTADEDIVWGLGLGCNGIVQILVERIERGKNWAAIALIEACLSQGRSGVLATIFQSDGSIPVGAQWWMMPSGEIHSHLSLSELEQAIAEQSEVVARSRESSVHHYEFNNGRISVLIESIQPPQSLIVFGAGQDAIPVVKLAKALGWMVTIVDVRSRELTMQRFAMADRVVLTRTHQFMNDSVITDQTSVVIMTHNYLDDLEILKQVILSSTFYIGLLGPKRRSDRLLNDLLLENIVPTNAQAQRLYGPVGLDLGGDTPEAIALSIIAEIQAVIRDRPAGMLRDRTTPIHHRPTEIIHSFDSCRSIQ